MVAAASCSRQVDVPGAGAPEEDEAEADLPEPVAAAVVAVVAVAVVGLVLGLVGDLAGLAVAEDPVRDPSDQWQRMPLTARPRPALRRGEVEVRVHDGHGAHDARDNLVVVHAWLIWD